MYGANPAISISTTPAIGSLTDCRSASIGADTWAVARRKITTSTSLDKIRAITNVAHFPIQPRVWSHEAPAKAIGANTMATSRSALRSEARRVGKEWVSTVRSGGSQYQ